MNLLARDLENKVITSPTKKVWRVTFIFHDGSKRKVGISPGRIDEEEAIKRAKCHAKIFDDAILRDIEIEKVDRQLDVSQYGMIQK